MKFLKSQIFNILFILGIFFVAYDAMKFQYDTSKKETAKNIKIKIIASAMQQYNLPATTVNSLGRQLQEIASDGDQYRYTLGKSLKK